ncbi:hypothetical protein AMQ84_04070 [Paenibacillus riograndensis]|uniref:YvrJ family protein n=1 Tax=Paenibacillus riograndensis TaxID=483937 RepID=A0A132U9I8_9BACL|nr:hypothetical protein AMQ84_04070 [Paenibacillus riograndensis]KWX81208.1 hypothetical protein AMQ83_34975 [Paenibacillus riograndensis]
MRGEVDPESIINLVTNIGFPAAISLILLKYVLQNMESQFKQLDKTVRELTRAVQTLNVELKKSASETLKKND